MENPQKKGMTKSLPHLSAARPGGEFPGCKNALFGDSLPTTSTHNTPYFNCRSSGRLIWFSNAERQGKKEKKSTTPEVEETLTVLSPPLVNLHVLSRGLRSRRARHASVRDKMGGRLGVGRREQALPGINLGGGKQRLKFQPELPTQGNSSPPAPNCTSYTWYIWGGGEGRKSQAGIFCPPQAIHSKQPCRALMGGRDIAQPQLIILDKSSFVSHPQVQPVAPN